MKEYHSSTAFLRSVVEAMVRPTEEEWDAFVSKLTEKDVRKNQVYLHEGEVCRKVGFVVKGCFRMYYIVEGEERTKDFQFEGQFTSSAYSLVTGKPALFCIAAVEDSQILEISRENLFQMYDRYKTWERMGRMYMERNFINKEVREASFLLDSSATRYKKLLDEQPDLFQRIPQKYIASYLGIKPESLSRLRKQFAHGNI